MIECGWWQDGDVTMFFGSEAAQWGGAVLRYWSRAEPLLRGDEVHYHVDDARAAGAAAQVHAGAPDLVLQQLVQFPAELLHQLSHLDHTQTHVNVRCDQLCNGKKKPNERKHLARGAQNSVGLILKLDAKKNKKTKNA